MLLFDTSPDLVELVSRSDIWHRNVFDQVLQEIRSTEDRAVLLLIRDLQKIGWHIKVSSKDKYHFEITAPPIYDKEVVRKAMVFSRNEIIAANEMWIKNHIHLAHQNLASGKAVLESKIIPRIEVCETDASKNIFRLFRYSWSSPYSEYVGRRIRLLIRDDGIQGSPVIGIAALGSSIIHISERDEWIGWDKQTRDQRIIYLMDAYVVGALPPYNKILGGKLISYILASNEIREIYKNKYQNVKTVIKKREASDLAMIITTSLYGKNSSQYNRIKYNGEELYIPIGQTEGFGTLHISNQTFFALKQFIEAKGYSISYKFGDGANWRMRVLRTATDLLGLDSQVILKHSFQRGIYAIPLAHNWKQFLNGEEEKLNYRDLPLEDLVKYWRERWFFNRMKSNDVVRDVMSFAPSDFQISVTE